MNMKPCYAKTSLICKYVKIKDIKKHEKSLIYKLKLGKTIWSLPFKILTRSLTLKNIYLYMEVCFEPSV
jgi:hypothetical protein